MKKIFEPVIGKHITIDASKPPKDNAILITNRVGKRASQNQENVI